MYVSSVSIHQHVDVRGKQELEDEDAYQFQYISMQMFENLINYILEYYTTFQYISMQMFEQKQMQNHPLLTLVSIHQHVDVRAMLIEEISTLLEMFQYISMQMFEEVQLGLAKGLVTFQYISMQMFEIILAAVQSLHKSVSIHQHVDVRGYGGGLYREFIPFQYISMQMFELRESFWSHMEHKVSIHQHVDVRVEMLKLNDVERQCFNTLACRCSRHPALRILLALLVSIHQHVDVRGKMFQRLVTFLSGFNTLACRCSRPTGTCEKYEKIQFQYISMQMFESASSGSVKTTV